ncbi:expressed protein [Dictyostelium purpureum]|uniref:Expressed protein n=1 Tax=Dictyostelium purpureum TaxID=5786 RepID=F0ZS32_DICPU|nr:uncharacterized protein DICPUDRAFT_95086 [Dictyostelium purpureum]EGC33233.1 expressed protein [Dictyostelium purpureum]|eukprot:XP_003290226.1 expressed protein [Dictyostelium purpureum]
MEDKSNEIQSSDFMESTGSILTGLIGSVPVVGSMLGGLFGALWPGPKYVTVEEFQKEIKKLKEQMIAMVDMLEGKIDAALDLVFNTIIDIEVLALINSGNHFSDAVNLWAERNGKKVTNIPKKKSKFAMEIQDLSDEGIKDLCRTQYQIFTDNAEKCIILLSDDRFNEYSLSALYICNGTLCFKPIGINGSVIGVKNNLHQKINGFHMVAGKGYFKALKKGVSPSDKFLSKVVNTAALVHYADKRLYKYPVQKLSDYTQIGSDTGLVMKLFEKTYVPWLDSFRIADKTKNDGTIDFVTGQSQITPLSNLRPGFNTLFNFKFVTPPCKKVLVNVHLAAFNNINFKINELLVFSPQYSFDTNSLPMNCPTMEAIRIGVESGGQVPSSIKYGIQSHIFEFDTARTSFEFMFFTDNSLNQGNDNLHMEDINFTLLE